MKRLFLALLAVTVFQTSYAADEKLDPLAVAVAHDLLAAMRFKFTLAAEMKATSDKAPEAMQQLVRQRLATNTVLTAEARAKLVADIEKKMPAAEEALSQLFTDPATTDAITTETAKIYARKFTVEEMQQMAAFYRTPTGAKMLALVPRVNAESLAFGQRYLAPRTDKLLEQLLSTASK